MKKPPLRTLVARKKRALKAANPKSRDRIRSELKVLTKLAELRKQARAV
jgi:TATA-binding protein-associated factor Taf7